MTKSSGSFRKIFDYPLLKVVFAGCGIPGWKIFLSTFSRGHSTVFWRPRLLMTSSSWCEWVLFPMEYVLSCHLSSRTVSLTQPNVFFTLLLGVPRDYGNDLDEFCQNWECISRYFFNYWLPHYLSSSWRSSQKYVLSFGTFQQVSVTSFFSIIRQFVLMLSFNSVGISFFIFFWGSYPAKLRGYSWLCTQELLQAVLRGIYGMLGIEPRSAACKANALLSVLLLQPLPLSFSFFTQMTFSVFKW